MALGRPGHRALAIALLLGSACGVASHARAGEVARPPPVTPGAGDASASHPSGLTLALDRVSYFEDSTLVVARLRNEATRELAPNAAGGFLLRDDFGNVYPLAAPAANREVALAPGATIDGAFVFIGRVHPAATRVTLEAGRSLGASNAPPLRLELPPPPAGKGGRNDVQANHPNGTELILDSLEQSEDSISLRLVATNGGRADVRLNGGRGLILIDDAGAVHALVPPPSNPEIVVPSGRRLDGKLVFAGRPSPQARKVRLVTNDQSGGSAEGTATPQPVIAVDLDLPKAGGVQAPIAQANHQNGTQISIRGVRRLPDRVLVDALVVNGNDRPVRLNNASGLKLFEAGGAMHALRPPEGDPVLEVAAAGRLDATLVFDGPASGRLTLVTNDGLAGSDRNPFTTLPVLRLDLPDGAREAADNAAPGLTQVARRALPRSRAEDGLTRAAEAAARPGQPDATLTGTRATGSTGGE